MFELRAPNMLGVDEDLRLDMSYSNASEEDPNHESTAEQLHSDRLNSVQLLAVPPSLSSLACVCTKGINIHIHLKQSILGSDSTIGNPLTATRHGRNLRRNLIPPTQDLLVCI